MGRSDRFHTFDPQGEPKVPCGADTMTWREAR